MCMRVLDASISQKVMKIAWYMLKHCSSISIFVALVECNNNVIETDIYSLQKSVGLASAAQRLAQWLALYPLHHLDNPKKKEALTVHFNHCHTGCTQDH